MNQSNLGRSPVKRMELRAVVLDVNGKPKQDLGVIGYYHRNPLKRFWYWLTKKAMK